MGGRCQPVWRLSISLLTSPTASCTWTVGFGSWFCKSYFSIVTSAGFNSISPAAKAHQSYYATATISRTARCLRKYRLMRCSSIWLSTSRRYRNNNSRTLLITVLHTLIGYPVKILFYYSYHYYFFIFFIIFSFFPFYCNYTSRTSYKRDFCMFCLHFKIKCWIKNMNPCKFFICQKWTETAPTADQMLNLWPLFESLLALEISILRLDRSSTLTVTTL